MAVGNVDDRPDYDYTDGLTLRVYALVDGQMASTTVRTVKGDIAATVTAKRIGSKITVDVDGDLRNWRVRIINCGGKDVEAEGDGRSITVDIL